MSLWKSLFGGGASSASATPKTIKQIEHNGFLIEAQPMPEGGQYRVCGVISKTIDGVRKEHRFIRADLFTGQDDTADITLNKGRQIIDQQGEKLFN
jgi:hypothetical protein